MYVLFACAFATIMQVCLLCQLTQREVTGISVLVMLDGQGA